MLVASPRTGCFYTAPPFGPDECIICQAENQGAVRERERVGGTLLAELVPSLETIGWSSYFANDPQSRDRG